MTPRQEHTALTVLVALALVADLLAWLCLSRQVRDLHQARLGRYLRLTDLGKEPGTFPAKEFPGG